MRLFHKFNSLNMQFFGLVDNIMLSVKPKTFPTKSIEYLRKYEYILKDEPVFETSDKYPNKIWQLWLQGNDMPAIVKSCTESVKKFHNEQRIMLTNDNLDDFVEIPEYVKEKHNKGIISHAHYSDIIRLLLLAKYGGCWVDATIYLTDKIPDDILSADFFTYRSLDSHVYKNITDYEQFKIYANYLNKPLSVESPFFFSGKPGNKIIQYLLALLLEYWKHENKAVDYLMMDQFFNLILINKPDLRNEFLNMPEYYLEDVLLLQDAQFEHFDKNLFDNIRHSSNVHKLTYKNIKRNTYKDSFLEYVINNI